MDTLDKDRTFASRLCWLVAAGLLLLAPIACSKGGRRSIKNIQTRPDHKIVCPGKGGGFREWGCGGEFIYALSLGRPKTLGVWKWDGGLLRKHDQVLVHRRILGLGWMKGGRWMAYRLSNEDAHPSTIVVTSARTGELLRTWPVPKGWYCSDIRLSRSGTHAAMTVVENYGSPVPDFDWDKTRVRVGLVGPELKKLTWVAMLVGENSADNLRRIRPSDDGAYVAVAGWNNGVAMIDVAAREVLWEIQPPGYVSLVDVAFSPDNRLVYAGGGAGCVYGLDVRTGQVRSRWFATETGKPIYGHRITTVAASADGRFVAAGTGPEGLVWLWSAKTGRELKVVDHAHGLGLITISVLAFSPNSKALATFAGGLINIWNLPE